MPTNLQRIAKSSVMITLDADDSICFDDMKGILFKSVQTLQSSFVDKKMIQHELVINFRNKLVWKKREHIWINVADFDLTSYDDKMQIIIRVGNLLADFPKKEIGAIHLMKINRTLILFCFFLSCLK
jgi:hypothetical protein